MRDISTVCVFCGSSAGAGDAYEAAARSFAREAVRRGIRLVYGGASVGLMGALADAALDAGGEVVGVIPRALVDREIAHRGLTELRVVATMHERKATMAELADAFVALPGGLGTLEELFEILTWSQLGIHRKPVGVLNVAGYYDPLVALLDHAVAGGFVPAQSRGLVIVDEDPARLLDRMAAHEPSSGPAWITPEEV